MPSFLFEKNEGTEEEHGVRERGKRGEKREFFSFFLVLFYLEIQQSSPNNKKHPN